MQNPMPPSTINHSSQFCEILGRKILQIVMGYRRLPSQENHCRNEECSRCENNHLPLIINSISEFRPIEFVLPAFPGKSPNKEKVLGELPDYAEKLSLLFLGEICRQIKDIYIPGVKIIICSDGRVFSDVVGINEKDVTNYQVELSRLIKELKLTDISLFNLEDHFGDISFNKMRELLLTDYSMPLSEVKDKIRKGKSIEASFEEKQAIHMYKGITRFLFEDSLHSKQNRTKSSLQRSARENAYEVIRRSNAWSLLIEEEFPMAIRLSIHPQMCGSKKLGIKLVGNDSWMTPWHGVAIETKNGFSLVKKSDAQLMGARLITDSKGRGSYYSLLIAPRHEKIEEKCHV